jgi:hypothetical protein
MEILAELLAPLLEFLAEILLQLVFEWLAQFGLRSIKAPFKSGQETSPWFAVIGYALYGTVIGAISLLIFPSSFVTSKPLRLANLIVTPLIVGGLMAAIGAWRRRHDKSVNRLDRFAYGVVFAFAMAAVRFMFASHG